MDAVFDNPDSIFIRVKAKDILFEGVTINCNQTIFPAKTVCGLLKENGRVLTDREDQQYIFSLMVGVSIIYAKNFS